MEPPRSATESATERLIQSRERLRAAWQAPVSPGVAHLGGASAESWKTQLARPAIRWLLESARTSWADHPLRIVGMVAGPAAAGAIRFVARRHPVVLIAGLAILGFWFARRAGLFSAAPALPVAIPVAGLPNQGRSDGSQNE
jgi:hypothetical protein